MNTRGLLVAVVILAALAGGVWWSNKHKKDDDTKPADAPPKILTVPEPDLKKIEITKRGSDPVVVEKNTSAKWEITTPKHYGTDQDTMSSLTSTLADLTSDRLVDAKVD